MVNLIFPLEQPLRHGDRAVDRDGALGERGHVPIELFPVCSEIRELELLSDVTNSIKHDYIKVIPCPLEHCKMFVLFPLLLPFRFPRPVFVPPSPPVQNEVVQADHEEVPKAPPSRIPLSKP